MTSEGWGDPGLANVSYKTNLHGKGLGGPLLGLNNPRKAFIQVGHCCYHLRWGMMVLKREANEIVVHTPIGIGQVQPTHSKGLVFLVSLLND